MKNKLVPALLAAGLLAGCASSKMAMDSMDSAPFGGPDSVKYSQQLWSAMAKAGLVGPGSLQGTPYTGQHPHGAILDTIDTTLRVGIHSGAVIVKRNYGGEGVSKSAVADDPDKYLKAVTVMYKREAGYDGDNANWFWAKYKPDGSLDKNPKGMQLAGRVAKGMPAGCIACHKAAPGGDYVFNNDRF